MEILMATPTLHPDIGGPAFSVPAIGRNLQQRGVRVRYATQSGDVHGAGPAGGLRAMRTSDVVHSFGIWKPYSHLVCLGARAARRPLVCSTMGMLEPWALAYHPWRKRVALRLYQLGDLQAASALVATADSELEAVRRVGLTAPVAVIPHGVVVPPVRAAQPARGPRTILFMGRLNPKKGVIDLVEAWLRLRPRGWRVVAAGPDEGLLGAAETALEQAGARSDFDFPGTVTGDAKDALFRSAALFVLPTYSENFGLVIAEALAYGVPVITTTGAPWRELQDTGSGWWVEPGVEPLLGALRAALALPSETLRAMGARGRELVASRYSWETSAGRYVELYQWVSGRGPKPTFVR
jgi:glycosyltransferase involved in cell wall biosynthesis